MTSLFDFDPEKIVFRTRNKQNNKLQLRTTAWKYRSTTVVEYSMPMKMVVNGTYLYAPLLLSVVTWKY
jgi:hypothetical protein